MKKVLIISYYWPPAGGGGVQRWLKFAKYLPKFNWQPILFVPENPDYPIIDETLLNDVNKEIVVLKQPIFEPYRWYRNLSGKKDASLSAGFITKGKPSLSSRIISWIRGNIILPDARRFWIKPSVRFLTSYLLENHVDVIITTGPPQSMHLIGLKLKRKLNIKWIADFRDPWVNMDHAEKLYMGTRAKNKHKFWESAVVKSADEVITASWHVGLAYEKIRGKKVNVITNGFDPADFPVRDKKSDEIIIGHFGTMGDDRNPLNVWKAISEWRSKNTIPENVKVIIAGPTDDAVLQSIREAGLADCLEYHPYLKHAESIKAMMNCRILLLPLNRNASEEGRIPGKIFEYMASGNFILGIGSPTGDSARILQESKGGRMFAYEDSKGISDCLVETLANNQSATFINEYERENLTKRLTEVLNKLA
jgi:glycosyltransferase involved in cell wall biosynthesis